MIKTIIALLLVAVLIVVIGGAATIGYVVAIKKCNERIVRVHEDSDTALDNLNYECADIVTDMLRLTDIGIPGPFCTERDRFKESFLEKALKELERMGY